MLILKKHEKAQIKAKIKRKNPENQRFSGFLGGDKRDRTADLLNAIGSGQKSSSDFYVFLGIISLFGQEKILYSDGLYIV